MDEPDAKSGTLCRIRKEGAKSDDGKSGGEAFKLRREVNLVGGISLLISLIVGSGIFITPKGVFRQMGSVGAGLLTWLMCGVLSAFAAISYAELGTMIPKSGGEYPILLEAYGPIPAYLFAWTSATILKPSSFAIQSLTFAKYCFSLLATDCEPPSDIAVKLLAAAVIGIVVFINCFSVKLSTEFVKVFTAGKILSLLLITVGGIVMLCQGRTENFQNSFDGDTPSVDMIALAFYQGLWSYDGWHQLNYVVEELQDPYVNLPRAIGITMVVVTVLYLLCNVAYLSVMTRSELLAAPAVGTLFGERVLGVMSWLIPLSVMWSVFGACLASCFTAGRISYAAGREGHFNRVLSMIHIRRLTPTPAVLLNGFFALLMIIPYDVDTLIEGFGFCMWMFHCGTCSALLYFRWKEPQRKRPIKVPLIFPIIACIAAFTLIVMPIINKPQSFYLYAVVYMLSGLVFYIPFVHCGMRSTKIRRFNVFVQKLLQVSEEE